AEGELVPNPIFSDLTGGDAAPRDPTLVFLGAIVGVPWQALADPARLPEPHYLTPPELERRGVWDLLLGQPEHGRPSADPFMRESIAERSGTSPITGSAIAPSTAAEPWANPINGHEIDFSSELDDGFFSDLQYSCIFALPSARPCGDGDPNCDCSDQPG